MPSHYDGSAMTRSPTVRSLSGFMQGPWALPACVLIVSTVIWPSRVALGQEPEVSLTLLAQTGVTTPDAPVASIRFSAQNLGSDTLEDLSVAVIVGPAIRSRDAYASSLVDGPGASPISLETFTQTGSLQAGASRELGAAADMSTIDEVSDVDSAIYPARIELRVAGVPVASIDTPLVHLVREPDVRIKLAWWTELTAPIAFDPAGLLADPAFEASIAPGGGLARQVDVLGAAVAADKGVDTLHLAIVPAVVDQLVRMADGYARASGETIRADEGGAADARALLEDLRDLVADDDVHVVTMPFSAPSLPSLASGGLAGDLDRQQDLGEAMLAEHLGVDDTTGVVRPPLGALDDASLRWLADRGATTVLAQADSVVRTAQPNGFAPLPTATVTTSNGRTLDLVLPDPGVQALLSDPLLTSDPIRASQAVLGELAAIWREQPVPGPQPDGTETIRGVAVFVPSSLPAAMWDPLVRRLTSAAFLRAAPADAFARRVNPVQEDAVVVQSGDVLARDYVDDIREQHRNVAAYRSMLAPAPLPTRFERNLLYAESAQYLHDPVAGRRWYDEVHGATDSVFRDVLPDVEQEFLLTSREGSIPIRMGDPGGVPLQVQVVLRSASFEFPAGAQQTVTLEGPNEIVTFDVVAKASGPQTIKVKIRAPSGRDVGEDQNLTVRTTAVSAVALWTTIGAGVALVLLWSRRLVRRPRP